VAQLLVFTLNWRYVTVREVHRAFADRYPPSLSTANYQLARLVEDGLLKVAPRIDRTRPKVYSLRPAGVRCLNRHYGWQLPESLARDAAVHPLLLDHEVELSRFQTDLFVEAMHRPDVRVPWFERRYFRVDRRLPVGQGSWYQPDLGFPLVHDREGKRRAIFYLLEWDLGTQRIGALRAKLIAGDRWYAGAGEGTVRKLYRDLGTDNQPRYRRLVIVAHHREGADPMRLAQLFTQALRSGDSARNILFTTHELIQAHRESGSVASSQIWFPVYRFPGAWLREIENELESSRRGQAVYTYVARRLQELGPTWRLFPPERR
jgi:hypothetical protein